LHARKRNATRSWRPNRVPAVPSEARPSVILQHRSCGQGELAGDVLLFIA